MSLQFIISSDKANKRTGPNSALVRCPCAFHEDNRPSCHVTETHDQILFHCYAGCDWKDVRDGACAKGWIDKSTNFESSKDRVSIRSKPKTSKTSPIAMTILANAKDAQTSPTALAYWQSRGLDHNTLAKLKFGSVFHTELKSNQCTLVAPVNNHMGQSTGVHLTYLEPSGEKLSQGTVRKMLGAIAGNSVHLADAGRELAIAEGIESAAAFQELSGVATWAALSTSGLKAVKLPPLPLAETVYIAADNDGPGIAAANAKAQRLAHCGRIVKITPPPIPGDDWNDALKRGAC